MSTQLDFEQLDLFDLFKDFVDSGIHDLITEMFTQDKKEIVVYSDLYYYPVFTRDEFGIKVLKRLMIKNVMISDDYLELDLEKVETSGASWEEVLTFLKNSPANCVNPKEIY
jgi:hypothetical protein